MVRCSGLGWIVVALALAAGATMAAPADDPALVHQRGMQAYQRGDVVGAMRELRQAADGGHAPSQAMLAFILDRADFAEEAAQLYRAAAQSDDPQGHFGLAAAYLAGRGLAKSEKRAWLHFSKAAELGHASAIEMVADAYRNGQLSSEAGAAPDAARAALTRAAERGHLPSIDALAQAYRGGQFGVAIDAVAAEQWRTRGEALRKQRGIAAAAPKR